MRLFVAALVLVAAPAAAQEPSPVSGYVVDIRGATSGLPKETAFFPAISLDTIVPARGFGFDVGAHVYLVRLGPSRLGVGASYLRVRGTTPDVTANVRAAAPQLSFNFGSRNGWSYVSAGVGRAWVDTEAEVEGERLAAESDPLNALNYGGGARWFMTRRVAVGFDLRVHRISGPPKANLFSASVGLSVR